MSHKPNFFQFLLLVINPDLPHSFSFRVYCYLFGVFLPELTIILRISEVFKPSIFNRRDAISALQKECGIPRLFSTLVIVLPKITILFCPLLFFLLHVGISN